MIYLIPLILLFLIAYHREYSRGYTTETNIPIFVAFMLYLVILMGLRYRVGLDTLNYMGSYDSVMRFRNTNLKFIFDQLEPLNYLIKSIAKNFSDDFVVYQAFHVVLLNILIGRFIIRNCEYILFALFFYFLFAGLYFNSEILRESVAVAIFLNAYEYIQRRSWVKYYLCATIALGFHTSALIIFVIPFLSRLRLNTFFFVFLGIFTLLIIRFQDELQLLVVYLDPEVSKKVMIYLEKEGLSVIGLSVALMRMSIIPIMILNLYKREYIIDFEYMIAIYILMGVGAIFIPTIFSRFSNYFIFFFIILLANSIVDLKETRYRGLTLIIVFIFSLSSFVSSYFSDVGDGKHRRYIRWYPYHSVISKDKDKIREDFHMNY